MKPLLITTLIFISVLTGISAIVLSPVLSPSENSLNLNSDPIDIIDYSEYASLSTGDPHVIQTAKISGNTLVLEVQYGGGCKNHTFKLLAPDAFMESSPVQIHVLLVHDAHDDTCEAWLTETVSFDLTPLKNVYEQYYPNSPELIMLQLTDYSDSLLYAF